MPLMFASEADDYDVSKQVDSASSTLNQIQKQIAGLKAQPAAFTTSKR